MQRQQANAEQQESPEAINDRSLGRPDTGCSNSALRANNGHNQLVTKVKG